MAVTGKVFFFENADLQLLSGEPIKSMLDLLDGNLLYEIKKIQDVKFFF